jgi:flavin-dependent dehydrogenase
MLMIGDSAGLIHPLCGNGMAMAIHSAKIASELVIKFYDYKIKHRVDLEKLYRKEWDFNFKSRLRTGRLLSSILQKPKLSEALIRLVIGVPFLLPLLIKNTHGKPIQ